MEEGQNYTNHEIGYPDVRGSHRTSPHKPSQCEREILERALINRINQYMYSMEFPNKNQYGFIPQTNTPEAIMALKILFRKDIAKVKSQQL